MSDLTIILIALVVFGAGYVVGHIHALVSYHKRRSPRVVVRNASDYRYDQKQYRGGRHG